MEIKFAADVMLGKLAKWLRILGYDTTYDSRITDAQLIESARRAGRVILTRDTRLVQRRKAKPYVLIAQDYVADQLRQLIRELKLDTDQGLLSRCLVCNQPLAAIAKSSIQDLVPPYVYKTQSRFYQCPVCQRIFWPATHVTDILHRLERIQRD